MTSDLCCIIYLLMNQNEIFSPLHKWEIGPIATHVLELIFHTAKMIQSFHYTFGKSRQFGPMFQYFRYRYLNCHFLSVTHRKNRDRPMIETLWQNQGVPAGGCATNKVKKLELIFMQKVKQFLDAARFMLQKRYSFVCLSTLHIILTMYNDD